MEGVDSGGRSVVGYGAGDSGKDGVESDHGAKNRVSGSLLCPDVHFLAVFLIDKCYGDVLSMRYVTGKGKDSFPFVTEYDVTNVNDFRAAGVARGCVLAGPHGVKERYNGEL